MKGIDIESFDDNFSNALNLFNNHKWYEAHDAFEDIWNNVDGDKGKLFKVYCNSVSQFHLSKGNFNGATILLGEGLGRIKTRTNINLGIDLGVFCENLELLLTKLQHQEKPEENENL